MKAANAPGPTTETRRAVLALVLAYSMACLLVLLILALVPSATLETTDHATGLLLRNTTSAAVLGKRFFRARPFLQIGEDSQRLVRTTSLAVLWRRLGIIELNPRIRSELEIPYEVSIRFTRVSGDIGLEIALAESGEGLESVVLDSFQPRDNGLFVRRGGIRQARLRENQLSKLCAGQDRSQLDILVQHDDIRLRCGSAEASIPHALEGHPILAIFRRSPSSNLRPR